MAKRRKVAEWWEVWWIKKKEPITRQNGAGGMFYNFRLPQREAFATKESAVARIKHEQNIYLRLVHVVRYKRY